MDLFTVLQAYPAIGLSCVLFLGLLVGSFLNVVIYRLPKMMERDWNEQCKEFVSNNGDVASLPPISEPAEPFNLMVPGSRCPHCGHKIKPWENIPVISYLALGGKCSECKAKISARYPIIEVVTGLLSIAVVYYIGINWNGLAALVLTWSLIALTMIDFDTYLLPDDITLPLLWLGLIVNSFNSFTDLPSALWGAIAGYLSLWSVYMPKRVGLIPD